MTDQQMTTELRSALARIAGMTCEEARRGTTGVLASILSDINETAEAALFEADRREYEAWRDSQPLPSSTVPSDLPY